MRRNGFVHILAIGAGLVLWFVVFGLMGCTITTKNNGKFFISWGTRIEVGSETAQTAPETAYSHTDVPSVEEWIRGYHVESTKVSETTIEPAPPVESIVPEAGELPTEAPK